jgi:single-strand DNA-binding protein
MNIVILEGRLTADPELNYKGGENASVSAPFNVAVNRTYKNAEGKYDADFIRCVAFGKSAEFLGKYFHKGDPIQVQGNIHTGSYVNKDGVKVYTTDVYVEKIGFVVGGGGSAVNTSMGDSNRSTPSSRDNSFVNIPESVDEELPFK